jgi:DNA-binding LacI/PurR family transcriptional regulator
VADIRDVAAHAKVSVGTVSNVLNGRHKKMRPETRQRVLESIKILNFTPSLAAKQLKLGHGHTLGLLVPSVANPFWGQVALHVERSAMRQGYSVLVCNGGRDAELEQRYMDTLRAHGVLGVIVASSPENPAYLAAAAKEGINIALFDKYSAEESDVVACSVSVDNELAGRMVAKHLLGLGHRRFGIISGPITTSSRRGRFGGFVNALREASVEIDSAHFWQRSIDSVYGDTEAAYVGRTAVREMLAGSKPPSALFCVNDMCAIGVYAGARDIGVRVPDDISVVGFDDIEMSELVEPGLTTIRQPIEQMANHVVEVLLGEITGHPVAERHKTFPAELVVRQSTGRV